jgi:hypothetical protein
MNYDISTFMLKFPRSGSNSWENGLPSVARREKFEALIR